MVYVVLGMHKSGTSLVSEILHHSGINMMERSDPGTGPGYDEGNKHERIETFALNNDILRSHHLESIDIPAPDPLAMAPEVRRRMAAVTEDLDTRYSDWGFKDPRVCYTYPLWASVLPEHRLIGIYRPMYELTDRYWAGDSTVRAYRLVSSWQEHNLRMLSYFEATSMPHILLSYGRIMADSSEFERLERFVGKPLHDRRRKDLRRGTASRGSRIRLAEAAYRIRTGRTTAGTLERLEKVASE